MEEEKRQPKVKGWDEKKGSSLDYLLFFFLVVCVR